MARARYLVPLALVAVVFACALILRSSGGPSGQRITARFDAVGGLIEGAPVSVGGVIAGRVESVGLGPGDQPQAELRLEDDVVVRQGAIADLRLQSQVGQLNRYIELTTGDGEPLPDGTVLSGKQTDQPVELDDALATLTPKARADVRKLTAAIDATLDGNGDNLAAVVTHAGDQLAEISKLAEVLADDAPALRSLVADGRKITDALAADPEGLQTTADQLAATLQVTARRQAELDASVAELGPGLRAARRALDSARAAVPDVRGLLADAQPAARQARASAPALAAALHAAPEALAAAEQLAVQAPDQLEAMRPTMRRAKPVVEELPPTLKQFLPVLEQMRARAPDALGWLPLLGDALSNYDENGHGGRLMLVLPTPSEDSVAATEQKPGRLVAPFDRFPGVLAGEPWLGFGDSMPSVKKDGGKP